MTDKTEPNSDRVREEALEKLQKIAFSSIERLLQTEPTGQVSLKNFSELAPDDLIGVAQIRVNQSTDQVVCVTMHNPALALAMLLAMHEEGQQLTTAAIMRALELFQTNTVIK